MAIAGRPHLFISRIFAKTVDSSVVDSFRQLEVVCMREVASCSRLRRVVSGTSKIKEAAFSFILAISKSSQC